MRSSALCAVTLAAGRDARVDRITMQNEKLVDIAIVARATRSFERCRISMIM